MNYALLLSISFDLKQFFILSSFFKISADDDFSMVYDRERPLQIECITVLWLEVSLAKRPNPKFPVGMSTVLECLDKSIR